jgi:hypothetical protein
MMMLHQIKIFILILSIIYTLGKLIEFVFKLFQDNPEPMVLTKVDKVLIHLSTSYIITFILT